ncbi:AP-4 complex subunit epsilon-1 isoform X2 [Oncorhynchus kisutch]|uniref:Adaptor related protein complex 4 subunit epsilon 1 n=1 Tax=Oncorhynchus kisutch TaxID=8019 RepID=A0A8C7HG80_ONCKI|nr:AP-4 complex subunit epsilon-1 isoform X2 [Oncorhynchus kisutch]
MSDVVEKTLSALPSLLSLDSQAGAGKLSPSSKLGNLIKGITELTSKHEEETLIKKELESIKEQVASPNTTMRQMKEIMVRAIYCEMLGYQASFSYIHAIKLAQQGSVLEKRVGYLAVSLFLNETDEFLLLLVNTVLKDLQSTNLIEVCMALTVVSQMFPKDMIPAILPVVEEKLTHPKEIIRRKAVLALYKFYLIAPNQVQHIHSKFRKALCDKDPGVMTASLHIYLQLIKENPESYKDLTGSMVTILRQVVGGKLPLDFNYHSVPAPWLQIQLLRILAYLGKEDQGTSEMMYDVLEESLRRAEMNHNITYAILFECVKTIYTVHPKSQLLEKAAECIGNFVLSPKINLKYLGLKALTYVVQQDANLALPHQMTIIECLDHSDVIIKRETLELLFRITNAQNVTVIVEKMLEFLRLTCDDYSTIDLVGKVAELAEKYSPDNVWFIQTMNSVFSLGGDVMQPDIPNNFLRLLAEGVDNVEDRQLRLFAVDSYVSLLQGETAKLPQRFLQVISWVLGEYSYLREEESDPGSVMRLLARLLDQRHTSTETRSWVLGAMTKLCSSPVSVALARDVCERYSGSLNTVLRQKAQELMILSQDTKLRARVLPAEGRLESPEVDSSLSFLDGYVSDALAAGAAPYKSPHQRQEDLVQEKALSLEPYGLSLPVSLSSCSITDRRSPTLLSMSSGLSGNSTELSHQEGSTTLKLEGVKRVWGKDGYLAQQQSAGETPTPLVELPSPLLSPQSPPSQKPSSGLEPDQEKRQLASSLFVGLGSHNSVCLMGRAETAPRHFRRKPRGESSSGASEGSSDSSHSSRSAAVDNLLHSNLLDSTTVASEGGAATTTTPQQTSQRTLDHTTSNGNPHVEGTEQRVEAGGPLSLIRGNGMVAVVPPTHTQTDPQTQQDLHPAPALERPRDLPLTSHLPAELSGLARSEFTPLCSDQDSSLALSACRVYKEDALVLLVFISNNNDSALHQMVLQLTCKELEISCISGSPLKEVKGHSVSVCLHTVVMKRASVQVELAGLLSYQRPLGQPQAAQFSLSLSLKHFLRPLTVSTGDYGKMWLSFSHDLKQNLRLVTTEHQEPLTATLDALKGKLHLHVVDIIGSEGIVACRLLQGPGQGQPCLLHCRVHADSLAVWLRSPVPELPDSLLYHCQKALTET